MRLTVLALTLTAASAHGGWSGVCGLAELIDRIGAENVPDGDGLVTCMVEAMSGSSYMPDADHEDLDGTIIIRRSGTSTGNSSHATVVARRMAGAVSFTPEVWAINVFETNDWTGNGWLHTNQGSVLPETLAGLNNPKSWNHAWVGTFGSATIDNNMLRRLDWTIVRDDSFVVGGVNNGQTTQPLPSYAFNTIIAGIDTADHAWGTVPSGYDGQGRRKPEIITPNGQVSFSVPWVTSAALMLVDHVRDTAGFPAEGERAEVLKSILLTSATHEPEYGSLTPWTNNPGTGADRGFTLYPLDEVVGAGTLNVNIAHLVLTGSSAPGDHRLEQAPEPPLNAWSLESLGQSDVRYWAFDLDGDVETFTATAAWHRHVSDTFTSWSLANLELELFRVADGGVDLVSLRGPSGESYFSDGNIACDSPVNNLEHLHAQNLVAGSYVLRLQRHDSDSHEGAIDVGLSWSVSDPVDSTDSDFDGDGRTGIADLLMMLDVWGQCGACPEDIDGSGHVDGVDLALLVDDWD